jgi:hypothetical protein
MRSQSILFLLKYASEGETMGMGSSADPMFIAIISFPRWLTVIFFREVENAIATIILQVNRARSVSANYLLF